MLVCVYTDALLKLEYTSYASILVISSILITRCVFWWHAVLDSWVKNSSCGASMKFRLNKLHSGDANVELRSAYLSTERIETVRLILTHQGSTGRAKKGRPARCVLFGFALVHRRIKNGSSGTVLFILVTTNTIPVGIRTSTWIERIKAIGSRASKLLIACGISCRFASEVHWIENGSNRAGLDVR